MVIERERMVAGPYRRGQNLAWALRVLIVAVFVAAIGAVIVPQAADTVISHLNQPPPGTMAPPVWLFPKPKQSV